MVTFCLKVLPACAKTLEQVQFSVSLMGIVNLGRFTVGTGQMVGRVSPTSEEKEYFKAIK